MALSQRFTRSQLIGLIVALFVLAGGIGLVLKPVMKDSGTLLDLEPQKILTYDLDYKSQGQGHFKGLPSGPGQKGPAESQEATMHVKGSLILRVAKADTFGFIIDFQLQPESWETEGMATHLQNPHNLPGQFVLTGKGQITSFSLGHDLYEQHAAWISDVLSLLTVALPEGEEKTWESSESNFLGTVKTLWTLDATKGSELQLSRVYQNAGQGSANIQGSARLVLSRDDYIQSLRAERERKVGSNVDLRSQDRTELVLEKRRKNAQTIAWTSGQNLTEDTLRGDAYVKKMQERAYQRILGDVDASRLDQLMNDLNPNKVSSNSEIYQIIKAFIALRPQDLHVLSRDFATLPYDHPRVAYVAMAMTAVGSPEAQKFLREQIEASREDFDKNERLIPHLGFVQEPDRASVAFLEDLSETAANERLQRTARLGLGTMAHNLREKVPEQSLKIFNHARDKLAQATTPNEKEHALRFLGNIGLPEQYASIEPLLQDPDERVRTEAYEALRHIDSAEARARLMEGAEQTQNKNVQLAALESLKFSAPRPEILPLYQRLLRTTDDMKVARITLGNIALLYPAVPEAKEALQTFLDNCGQTDLCSYTSSTLASLP